MPSAAVTAVLTQPLVNPLSKAAAVAAAALQPTAAIAVLHLVMVMSKQMWRLFCYQPVLACVLCELLVQAYPSTPPLQGKFPNCICLLVGTAGDLLCHWLTGATQRVANLWHR